MRSVVIAHPPIKETKILVFHSLYAKLVPLFKKYPPILNILTSLIGPMLI